MAFLGKGLLSVVAVMAVCVGAVSAGTIEVVVQDRDGNPVPDVVVLAESNTDTPLKPSPGPMANFEMNQVNLMFSPHVLVVPPKATVEFLNSDATAHHVYSFSKTKRFTLPLYKGRAPDPVTFNTPGIVTLGCNIHDHMVGYIVVAESHFFATTDVNGTASIHVNGAVDDMQIRIWSPRIKDRKTSLVRDASDTEPLRFMLKKKLKPAFEAHHSESGEWKDY